MVKAANPNKTTIRTTVDIPDNLLVEIDKALKRGIAKSRNAFMIQAIQSYLKQLNLQLSEEFTKADWEAWQIQLNKGIKDL